MNFQKRSKEQTKASKVQVKSETASRLLKALVAWRWGPGRPPEIWIVCDDDDSNDDGDGDEDEDNLSCEEGVHEEQQLLQLGTDHLLGHLRTMFSVHFVWHIPGHGGKPSLLQDSHEFKRKTFNLLFCERLEKVQPQSCVAIVRRALGTRRFHF